MKRHQKLSMRKPESLLAARAAAVNPVVIGKWFDDLEKLMVLMKIKDRPANNWNVDETGVQNHLIGEKGKDSYQVTSGEKGVTTTVMADFNALNKYTPIVVIFKGKRCKPEWLNNAPSSTMVRMSPNGWVYSHIFMDWGKSLLAQLPTDDESVALGWLFKLPI